jgi:DNA-binding transcriptional LysR family regulator
LLQHACLRLRFGGRAAQPWEFKRNEETVKVDPDGPLLVEHSGAADLLVVAARAGSGIVYLFEDWLREHLESGVLEAVLQPWWQSFSGPFLYYPGRRLVPPPLRAFIDHIRNAPLA